MHARSISEMNELFLIEASVYLCSSAPNGTSRDARLHLLIILVTVQRRELATHKDYLRVQLILPSLYKFVHYSLLHP